MMLRQRGLGQGHRGVATVEFAILAPFLFFLFVLALDFARIFYFGVVVENSARNGAYYACNYPNASYLYNDIYGYKDMEEAVLKDAAGINSPANAATYQVGYGSNPAGPFSPTYAADTQYVQVSVSWGFYSLTAFPGLPTYVNLNRAVIMKMAPVMPNF